MRVFLAAALLVVSVAPFVVPGVAAAPPCHPLPEVGPGFPPQYVTVYTDCVAHCDVVREEAPGVLGIHPECLGPE